VKCRENIVNELSYTYKIMQLNAGFRGVRRRPTQQLNATTTSASAGMETGRCELGSVRGFGPKYVTDCLHGDIVPKQA